MGLHSLDQCSSPSSELTPGKMDNLMRSAFSDFAHGNLVIFPVCLVANNTREKQVFGEVQTYTSEPFWHAVHPSRFIEYLCVGALMDQLEVFPAEFPECRTVLD